MARKSQPVSGVYEKNVGSGIWYIRYRVKGKLVRKKIGTKGQASDELDRVKYIRSSGSGVVPATATLPVRTFAEQAMATSAVTLGELCDGLLKQIAGDPLNYVDQYNPPIRVGRIKKAFGNRLAETIRPWEIADWLACQKAPSGKPWSIGTRNRYKGVWSAIFTHGKEREKITNNPCKDFKGIKEGEGVIRYLSDDEEVKLRAVLQADVDACDPFRHPLLRKHCLHRIHEMDVALGTGVRRSEQYRLTWPDVNYGNKDITLNRTKYGPGRVVHMTPDVEYALRELQKMPLKRRTRRKGEVSKAPADSVFSLGDNKKWFQGAVTKSGIKKFRWHDLRHTFISRMVQAGHNLKVIQEAAGHRTIAMTARYAHLNKTNVAEAMDSMSKRKVA